MQTTAQPNIVQLIYRESGGFTGLQRGCTIEPQALPDTPRAQLQSLLVQPLEAQHNASLSMPDVLVYTLEMVLQPQTQPNAGSDTAQTATQTAAHRTVQYPAGDVPDDVTDLIDFLQTLAQPLNL
jgi:hypothetical protein